MPGIQQLTTSHGVSSIVLKLLKVNISLCFTNRGGEVFFKF